MMLGIDRVLADPTLIGGSRPGLVTNYTGVSSDGRLSSLALANHLTALFTPEHGLRGTVQAGESEAGGTDPLTGLPVIDTYRLEGEDLASAIASTDIDVLLVDIQDIGARFYTYVWTMVDCLRACASIDIPVVILDRPNPLGGDAAGPGLEPGFESFIGRLNIPIKHGLTIGELGRVAAALDREAGHKVPDPSVVEMIGWRRSMTWAETGLRWVMPSPNMPTEQTALAFVGTALFEGTNVSEGRGTTRPFEIVGAPWLDESYARQLNEANIPGAFFRPAWFNPTFNKWQGHSIGGAQVYLEPGTCPITAGLHMLHLAAHADFAWREPVWEQSGPRPYFVDLMWGSTSLRENVDDLEALLAQCDARELRTRDEQWLLYEA